MKFSDFSNEKYRLNSFSVRIKYQPTVPNFLDSSLENKPKYLDTTRKLKEINVKNSSQDWVATEDCYVYVQMNVAGNVSSTVSIDNIKVGIFYIESGGNSTAQRTIGQMLPPIKKGQTITIKSEDTLYGTTLIAYGML